jgi:hypothetical protein
MYEKIIMRSPLQFGNPLFVLSNSGKNILNILKERFEKKCHKHPDDSDTGSFYVEKVIRVVSHTEPVVSQLGSDTTCSINNIEFEVDAIRCLPDEILNGCIVGANVPNAGMTILMRNPCMHILILATEDSKLIGEGKYISVVVNKAVHKYGKSLIVISGIPLFASIKTPAFKVDKDKFTAADANSLKIIYSEKFASEAAELDAIKEVKSNFDRRSRLRDHLYGLKDFGKRNEVPKGVKVVNVKDFMDPAKIKSGWYFRSIMRDMDSEDVFFCEKEEDIPADVQKETRLYSRDAFSSLMRHYHQGMVTLREWTFIYDGDMEKAHSNLWRIFNNNKK